MSQPKAAFRLMTCGVAVMILLPGIAAAQSRFRHVEVFRSGEDGYHTYRIPAIEAAKDGTLVAFAEARKYNSADPGFHDNDIDLVMKRSSDGGVTWSEMLVVEDPGEKWSAANPAIVLDRQSGHLLVFYIRCQPHRSSATARPGTDDILTLIRTSSDGGRTWSDAKHITRMARDYDKWPFCVVGPGGATQLNTGRIVASCCTKAPSWIAYVIYSDDRGETWQRSSVFPEGIGCNECQAVQRLDGSVLLDARQVKGPHRWQALSRDGGETWDDHWPGVGVTPVCCAIERWKIAEDQERHDCILWTGPKGPGRNNLVARVSNDGGKTFPVETLVAEGPAAYSDLTLLDDGDAGVLWERGGYKQITFTRLSRDSVRAYAGEN
jgi:sialidase-1